MKSIVKQLHICIFLKYAHLQLKWEIFLENASEIAINDDHCIHPSPSKDKLTTTV